ncbi:MAG: hypothetical protein IPN27_00045 [Cellvibrionales bacterium]|nr:hypothetical protein [Cellvibrionales bacterium]
MKIFSKKFFLTLIVLSVTGCAPTEQLLNSSTSKPTSEIGRLFISSQAKVGTDPYELGVGVDIVSIEFNGSSIKPPSGVVQLEPGHYVVKAKWWRVTKEDYTSLIAGPVAGLLLWDDKSHTLRSNGTYNIELNVKAGKTYIPDIASTVKNYSTIPEKICMTEEDYDAPGASYPAVGKIFRYPSANAPIAGCAPLTPTK